MIITFLGTGTSQGVPVIACECQVCQSLDFRDKRLRTSIHVEVDEQSIVVDTGPDFRTQMLRERIDHLDAILFTHAHKDHTAGLDDVRSFNFKQKYDMPVYGRKEVLEQLQQEFSYIFAEKKYPGVPRVILHEIENKAFSFRHIDILPIDVLHYRLPVFGFRIKNFTYITDVNSIGQREMEKIKGSEVLVLSALQKEDHISHFNLSQAIDLINELAVPKAYLIHMSHRLGLHAEIEKELPPHIQLAYDGLKIEL